MKRKGWMSNNEYARLYDLIQTLGLHYTWLPKTKESAEKLVEDLLEGDTYETFEGVLTHVETYLPGYTKYWDEVVAGAQ